MALERIKAGSLVHIRVFVYNNRVDPPVLYNPSTDIRVTVTDPNGVVEVNNLAMTSTGSTGGFYYDWASSASDATGDYLVSFRVTDVSGTTLTADTVGFVLV